MMASSSAKTGFYWALTALQLTPENRSTDSENSSPIFRQKHTNELKEKPDCVTDSGLNDNSNSGVENVKPSYSRDDVSYHCTPDSCWMVINNKVYDVTRFLRMHPGGEDIILEHGGYDATTVFIDKGHSRHAYDLLKNYLIGEVTQEDRWPEKRAPYVT